MATAIRTDEELNVQQVIQSMEGGTAIAEQINQIHNTYAAMPEEVQQSTVMQSLLSQLTYVEKRLADHALHQRKGHWRVALNDNAEKFVLWLMGALFVAGVLWSIYFWLGPITLLVLLGYAVRRYRQWQTSLEGSRQEIEQSKQEIQHIQHKITELKQAKEGA